MKPTKGPWLKSGQSIKSKTRMVCHLSIGDDECKANAKLISKSPEMLDALEDVSLLLCDVLNDEAKRESIEEVYDAVNLLLEKIRGES